MPSPPLTIAQILAWADAHFARTGKWPTCKSGPLLEAPSENWSRIDAALRHWRRGITQRTTLSKLLNEHRRGATKQPARKEREPRVYRVMRG